MSGNLSEYDIIQLVQKQARGQGPNLEKGIGDDCAVFSSGKHESWLITTDILVDSIHFDKSFHPPQLLGRKCVAVSFSDIAAMGGEPRFVLLAISVPAHISSSWLTSFLEGVTEIVEEHDCLLIGGDTVQSKELTITITVLGNSGPGEILFRSGACEHDTVYVSGFLGDSGAGLKLLQNYLTDHKSNRWSELIQAHLNPTPQVSLGKLLAQSGCVTSMQDISDGLATDLSHICKESGVSALLTESLLPKNPLMLQAADHLKLNSIDLQLFSGEDYQLVFTVQHGRENELESMINMNSSQSISAVGKIQKGSGVYLQQEKGKRVEVTFKGYEHTMQHR